MNWFKRKPPEPHVFTYVAKAVINLNLVTLHPKDKIWTDNEGIRVIKNAEPRAFPEINIYEWEATQDGSAFINNSDFWPQEGFEIPSTVYSEDVPDAKPFISDHLNIGRGQRGIRRAGKIRVNPSQVIKWVEGYPFYLIVKRATH
jgi:hypothetical protein